jgi:hypothetical protein
LHLQLRQVQVQVSNPMSGIPRYLLLDCFPAQINRDGVVANNAPRNDGVAFEGEESLSLPPPHFRHCEEGVLRLTTLAPAIASGASAGEQSNDWQTKIVIEGLLPGTNHPGRCRRNLRSSQ